MTSILITGGTGTFGKAFTSRCLNENMFDRIVLFSRDEYKQHNTRRELSNKFGHKLINERIRFFIGDVRDRRRLDMALSGCNYVIHAAALKHVHLCEYNPFEAVKTNIVGTQNLIEAAIEREVKKVICLSTDKSVNPINLYGSTKLCLEKICINANYLSKNGTVFYVVRYGNVIGSRGSVIPYIMDMARKGQTFELTDPNMTRFWLSIEEAVDICFSSFDFAYGREILVPKMKSLTMAELLRIIAPKLKIKIVGTRPGEKMHETMIAEHEIDRTYNFSKKTYVILPEENKDFFSVYKHDFIKVDFTKYTSDSVERYGKEEFLKLLDITQAMM